MRKIFTLYLLKKSCMGGKDCTKYIAINKGYDLFIPSVEYLFYLLKLDKCHGFYPILINGIKILRKK